MHIHEVQKQIDEAIFRQIITRNGQMPTEEESRKLCSLRIAHDYSVIEMFWEGQLIMKAFPAFPGLGSCIIVEVTGETPSNFHSKWD